MWGQVAARLQHWAKGVKDPWFQGGGDCTYPSVALNPPGAGWPMPAALPSVLPASGAHPGPAQACSDSGSCCGAWCPCGPSPCLVPGPCPSPDLDLPCPAPCPSPSPCPSPGCALAASLAPAVGSVPAPPPSPAPSALLLLAPFAASPAPWPVQPALPPSEQSVAGREGREQESQPCSHESHLVSLHLDPALSARDHCQPCCYAGRGRASAVTSVLVSEPQALLPVFIFYAHDR